jgi:hypothetical protein
MNWLYYKLNPFQTNEQALVWASRHGYVDIVDDLLNKGTDPNILIYFSVPSYDPKPLIIEKILYECDSNEYFKNLYLMIGCPLSVASFNGHKKVVERLLQDTRTMPAKSLEYAAINNHIEIYKLIFLKYNYKNCSSDTIQKSYDHALRYNNIKIVDFIQKNYDVSKCLYSIFMYSKEIQYKLISIDNIRNNIKTNYFNGYMGYSYRARWNLLISEWSSRMISNIHLIDIPEELVNIIIEYFL